MIRSSSSNIDFQKKKQKKKQFHHVFLRKDKTTLKIYDIWFPNQLMAMKQWHSPLDIVVSDVSAVSTLYFPGGL